MSPLKLERNVALAFTWSGIFSADLLGGADRSGFDRPVDKVSGEDSAIARERGQSLGRVCEAE